MRMNEHRSRQNPMIPDRMYELIVPIAATFPRLTGPLGFRFIVQPIAATLLGIRDGRRDVEAGEPPYLLNILLHPEKRWRLWRGSLRAMLIPVLIGIILDGIAQSMIFSVLRPGQAILVGAILIGLPYISARGLINRYLRMRLAHHR
jgi:hypothetical protein